MKRLWTALALTVVLFTAGCHCCDSCSPCCYQCPTTCAPGYTPACTTCTNNLHARLHNLRGRCAVNLHAPLRTGVSPGPTAARPAYGTTTAP